ncbi:MAG: FAD-dependent oxidoreductase [Gammaproteobacteria bacterium]|jgi:sulfide dehydrogenase [flavocytochrome c] flavoprotein subunit|nr:FAD-dependent oxidoreductase [Gammaproteobacteria bacterium]MBT3721960.1 FAD-dependent oxidoreductase [Gammaproteobacteria bacterium]MBT4075859.1 FAD-dependent oxidoreductase [Gammaproteobacteria bacterium]MBT4195235.1 FAD-dependent oxidoreductase [Gammaproteobacteria bacterium]MBT4451319.1 FAD-dependent oxidoreductase [Gammaproteobacteria bacterium]
MSKFSRRDFIKAGAAVSATSFAAGFTPFAIGGSTKKVVVVGGGVGGATAAKYIKMADPSIDVTIIEANKDYYTCFFSNEVLSGVRELDSLHAGYSGLKKRGINMVYGWVDKIDPKKQVVKVKGGKSYKYDRCIVSPGVDFKWDTIDGLDASVAETTTHAWKAGPQTLTLKKQLQSMKKGGTFIIAPPPNPFRCPPGPGERITQMANYFKVHNPTAKIIAFDPKKGFSKKPWFQNAWERFHGFDSKNPTGNGMISYHAKDGVVGFDPSTNTVTTASGNKIKGDVVNIIPAQKAGKVASSSGLTNDKGWCPVDPKTFESTMHSNIHIVGDSSVASPMPKSGYAANSQAKVCALAVVALMNGDKVGHPTYVNTCYSFINEHEAISVAMVYDYKDGKIIKVKGSGGLTPKKVDLKQRAREAEYAHSWWNNIVNDGWG